MAFSFDSSCGVKSNVSSILLNGVIDGNVWLQAVPFQFLHALLTYLGDSVCPNSPSSGLKSPLASHPSSFYPGVDTPSEGLIRWKLRLEYFAYETLQDLRIAKLFDIIVDYPDRFVFLCSFSLQLITLSLLHYSLLDYFLYFDVIFLCWYSNACFSFLRRLHETLFQSLYRSFCLGR